mgnify:CR=1 FL=1
MQDHTFLEMVLILVLMEDGLRVCEESLLILTENVLILVLMEDGLRDPIPAVALQEIVNVLILVLMEDGLRG